MLSEIHIQPTDEISVLNVMEYKFLTLQHKTDSGRVVGLYISNQHYFKCCKDLKNANLEIIRIKIFHQKLKSFFVCTIYQPPEHLKHLHENFAKLFNMFSLAVRSFKGLILLRDINVNYLVKDDQNKMKYAISSNGIEQLIKQPTRFDLTHKISMLIDIIGTNNESNFLYSHVIPLFIGDHDMVGCLHKINCKKFVPCSIICRDYSKYDPESFCIDIKNSNINLPDQFKNVNKPWGPLNAILLDIFNMHVPAKKRKLKLRANQVLAHF